MESKPRLLDLFCGAGGASMGYHRAGFGHIVGVDNEPQPHYPFHFIQWDALDLIRQLAETGKAYTGDNGKDNPLNSTLVWNIKDFNVYHASPPCQFASNTTKPEHHLKYTNLIPQTREFLQKMNKPYVIENVFGARRYLINPLMLCGTMFGLGVIRHRYFETNPPVYFPPAHCAHQLKTVRQGYLPTEGIHYITVTGNFKNIPYAKKAMGIDWMTQKELAQAIPPIYTEFLGKEILKQFSLLRNACQGVNLSL